MIKDNIVIRGSFYSLTKMFVVTLFCAVATIFLFYKLLLPGTPTNSDKYEELVLSTIGIVIVTSLFYWILTSYYYYYELKTDKIIVRNILKPYFKELQCSTLQYINLYGDITTSKTKPYNSLEFMYRLNDSKENFRYHSLNYNQDDWKLLIVELKKLNIRIEDPNKEFFKNSDIKLDALVEPNC